MRNGDVELLEQRHDCSARRLLCSKPEDAFLERQQGMEARSYRRFKGLHFGVEELDEFFASALMGQGSDTQRYSRGTRFAQLR